MPHVFCLIDVSRKQSAEVEWIILGVISQYLSPAAAHLRMMMMMIMKFLMRLVVEMAYEMQPHDNP